MRAPWLLALALMACAKAPEPQISYRDPAQGIASKAIFDPQRFAGAWFVVAQMGSPDCAPLRVDYAIDGAQVAEQRSCPTARFAPEQGALEPLGRLRFDNGIRWVLWADEGYRTAVLGAPDGRFGWILNRTAQIPADRMRAAREIMDFNGYDLSRLVENR